MSALISIKELGKFGIVRDTEPYELPLNAWTNGRNVRFRENRVERMSGHDSVYADATVATIAPHFLMWIPSINGNAWLYAGATKVGALVGTTHGEITPASPFTSNLAVGWTGGVLGTIPVINNGVEAPHYWGTGGVAVIDVTQDLTSLANWPASYTCRTLRVFKNILVALDVTKSSGVRYPGMVKWSHPADPGALPATWDPTDVTRDAGEYEIGNTSDPCIDLVELRDNAIIYKEQQTWGMQYIGGIYIMRFAPIFKTFGCINRRCAVEFFSGRHLVFTGDDIIVHDGAQAESVVDARWKKYIRTSIDLTNYQRSFVALNYNEREVWFVYPTTGSTLPQEALVWNWIYNTWGIRSAAGLAFMSGGVITVSSDTWDAASGVWDTDTDIWDVVDTNPLSRVLLAADPTNGKLFRMDSTEQMNAADYTAYVERTGLGVPLKENGPPDFTTMKEITRIWPKITGTTGATVNVYVGSQGHFDDTPTYKGPFSYTIGTTQGIDCEVTGRLHAIKIESTTAIRWSLTSLNLEVAVRGERGW